MKKQKINTSYYTNIMMAINTCIHEEYNLVNDNSPIREITNSIHIILSRDFEREGETWLHY